MVAEPARRSAAYKGFVVATFGAIVAYYGRMASIGAVAGILVMLLAMPIAHADTLLYVDRLAVYDATGIQIGTAWPTGNDAHGSMVVEFRLGSRPIVLPFRENKFLSPYLPYLRFEEPGCTGQLLIADPERWNGVVVGPRWTVYVQSQPARERTARSYLTGKGVCTDRTVTHPMAGMQTTGVDLADHFVPPFTVQTRGRVPVPPGTP
jgi:hypothetical protein